MSNEVKEDPVLSLWLKFRGTKSYLVLGGICWVSMCIVNSKFIYQTVDVTWITHIKLSLGILTVRDNILVIEIGQMLSKGVEDWLFVFTCFYACFLLISWLSCEKIYFHFCTQMFSAFCVFFFHFHPVLCMVIHFELLPGQDIHFQTLPHSLKIKYCPK